MLDSNHEISVKGQNLTKEVFNTFSIKYLDELSGAEDEQIKLMEAERRATNGERKNLKFGYVRMKVCPEIYHFWTKKLGSTIWQDEGFKKWLENRFGDLVKIKSISGNIIV